MPGFLTPTQTYTCETVNGLFRPLPWPESRDKRFGLLERFQNSSEVEKYVKDLNDSSKSRGSEERYLLAYVGRHGKPEHNAEIERTMAEWKSTYGPSYDKSAMYRDAAKRVGIDPSLITTGWTDACETGKLMRECLPEPDIYYCSPLRRTLQTQNCKWGDLSSAEPTDRLAGRTCSLPSVLVENLSERYHTHDWNRRESASSIEKRCQQALFVEDFDEQPTVFDRYKSAERVESVEEHTDRVYNGVNWIIQHALSQDASIIDLTTHQGTCTPIMEKFGRPYLEDHPTEGSFLEGEVRPTLMKITPCGSERLAAETAD